MRRVYISKRTSAVLILALAGVVTSGAPARGQSKPAPNLFYVVPSGGQAGSTFEVTVSGQNLDQPQGLYFDVPGVKTQFVGTSAGNNAPTTMKRRGGQKPAKQASATFKVTLPVNARPGIHDVRIITPGGLSNPRAFVVGDLKEVTEKEPNDDVPQAQRVDLNSTISGVISAPTDVDYFTFTGKKGQRVIASCLTTSIDSRLPAVLEMYGAVDSKYLGSGRGYDHDDALLDCVLPADGDYLVRVASFTYTQGGPDYYYRLSISTTPWIDAVFPPAVEAGKTATVAVYGRNLPGGKLDPAVTVDGKALEKITMTVTAPADPVARQRLDYTGRINPASSGLDGFELRLRNDSGASNPFLITYADAPVVTDNGANDTPEQAQKLMLPCEVAGWIEKKSDRDCYSFQAKKGDVYSIELLADRLGAPFDAYFTVRDAKGKLITEQDDSTDIMSPQFYTRTNDPPRFRFTVPADGEYQVMVSSRDAFVQAGPRHQYLLRIAPEKPDFRLIAMPVSSGTFPEASVVGQGGNQTFQVLAWQRDGFNADIELSARNLPPGVTLVPQAFPAGQKQGFVVVSAAPQAAAWTGALDIVGTATVKGQKLVREVRAATVTWPVPQNNIPAISRLDRSLVLAVRDKAPFVLALTGDRFSAPPGGKVVIPVKLTRSGGDMKNTLYIVPLNVPNSFNFKGLTLAPGKDTGKAELDIKQNAVPGSYTVVFAAQTQPPGKPQPNNRNKQTAPPQPSTPVTVTIVPKKLGTLTVTPQTAKVPAGKETTISVKMSRLYDYEGPFKVEVVLPKGANGIQVSPGEIKVGANDTSLTVKALPGAAPGDRPNVMVRVTAIYHGHPIVQEAKLNINVSKAK